MASASLKLEEGGGGRESASRPGPSVLWPNRGANLKIPFLHVFVLSQDDDFWNQEVSNLSEWAS